MKGACLAERRLDDYDRWALHLVRLAATLSAAGTSENVGMHSTLWIDHVTARSAMQAIWCPWHFVSST